MFKQYLVFIFSRFYPLGGWEDFQTSTDNISSAKIYGLSNLDSMDTLQIVDSHTGKIVYEFYKE